MTRQRLLRLLQRSVRHHLPLSTMMTMMRRKHPSAPRRDVSLLPRQVKARLSLTAFWSPRC
jgi:hypothetical protein